MLVARSSHCLPLNLFPSTAHPFVKSYLSSNCLPTGMFFVLTFSFKLMFLRHQIISYHVTSKPFGRSFQLVSNVASPFLISAFLTHSHSSTYLLGSHLNIFQRIYILSVWICILLSPPFLSVHVFCPYFATLQKFYFAKLFLRYSFISHILVIFNSVYCLIIYNFTL